MSHPPMSSPTSAPTEFTAHRGGGGGPNTCNLEQTACMSDDACSVCMAGAKLDGSCVADAIDCSGISSYFCCLAGEADEGCTSNPLLLDFISEFPVFSPKPTPYHSTQLVVLVSARDHQSGVFETPLPAATSKVATSSVADLPLFFGLPVTSTSFCLLFIT